MASAGRETRLVADAGDGCVSRVYSRIQSLSPNPSAPRATQRGLWGVW